MRSAVVETSGSEPTPFNLVRPIVGDMLDPPARASGPDFDPGAFGRGAGPARVDAPRLVLARRGSGLAPGRVATPRVQARLRVSQPSDPAEVEADRAAEQLLAGGAAQVGAAPGGADVHRQAPDEEEDEPTKIARPGLSPAAGAVAAKRRTPGPLVASPAVAARLEAGAGGGVPLRPEDRARFEPGLGIDLGEVRIHADADAARVANATDALALTYGRDVYFAADQYAPETPCGARLLAHELAHVAQQAQGAPAIQRRQKPAGLEDYYPIKVLFDKDYPPDGDEARVLLYAQAFNVSIAAARGLLARYPTHWERTFTITNKERAQGYFTAGLDTRVYDAVVGELESAATPGAKKAGAGGKGVVGKESAEAAKAEDRARQFRKLPKSEQKKIEEEFLKRTGYKPRKKLGPGKSAIDKREAELWIKVRDQLLRLREKLGELPPAVRDTLGDPSQYTPAQYLQLLRIGRKLEGLSAEDLQLYRIIASSTTTDLDAVEKSLDHFIEIKEKYRKALEANAQKPVAGTGPTTAPGEAPLEQQLEEAWTGFDKAGFKGMGKDEGAKRSKAREIAYKRARIQLKYMAKHPGQTAVGMVKGLSPVEVAKGIAKDIKEFKNAESSWGKWASGFGIGGKVSGWVAGVAAVAWVVMWFIPGVNLAQAMATAMAVAFAAGFAAVLFSAASSELHIRAAGTAETEEEFRRQTNAAAEEMVTSVLGAVLLVAAVVLRFLGRVRFVQRYLNIGRILNDAKVKAWKALGVDALKAVRNEAVAAVEAELAKLDAELKPATAEHAALRKQIADLSPKELMKKIATDPDFAQQLGLDPAQAKAFGPAAEGPLAEHGAPQAKAKLLQAMDDAAAQAQARINRFKADGQKVIADLKGADSKSAFDAAVDRALKTMSPEEQARISAEAGEAYKNKKLQEVVDELKARAEAEAKAAAEAPKPAPPKDVADPTKQAPEAAPKEQPAAAAPEDAYSHFGKANGVSDAAVARMRAAGVDLKRVEALMKGGKYPGKTAEVAAETAAAEVGLAKALEDAGIARGKTARQTAAWAGDAGIINKVSRLLDFAKQTRYGNPKGLPKFIEWIGKGSKQHIQALDDALARLEKGHQVDIEAEADVVDRTPGHEEAIQHKQVGGRAKEALRDNVKKALEQLAGKGKPTEVPKPGYKRVADARITEPDNPYYNADAATLEKYLKNMKAESDRLRSGDPEADPNAELEKVDSDVQVRITNAKGTFNFNGPDFDLVK